MHSFVPSWFFWFFLFLFPANGQLILHTKTQITRHHHRHHSYHAPSPPEWVQALQRPQQPLGVFRTDTSPPQSAAQAPATPAPKIGTPMPGTPNHGTDFRDSKILNTSPRVKNSDVLVSISFTSIPRWPDNGEQVDFLTVPLGKWTRPEDSSGLPQRPLKVKMLGVKHRSKPDPKDAAFEGEKRVVCRLYTVARDGSHGVPITFQHMDGEIDLMACGTKWSMGEKVVESFGCVLV